MDPRQGERSSPGGVMAGVNAALLLRSAWPAAAQQFDGNLASETYGTRTLGHEITVPASLEEVWTALATVDGWRTWAVPLAREVPGSPDHFETGYDAGAEPGAASTIEQPWPERTKPYRVDFRTTWTPEGFPQAEAYGRTGARPGGKGGVRT